MIANMVSNLFTVDGFSQLLRVLVVASEVLYVIFAFIVTREVKLMNSSFKTGVGGFFSLVALIHFLTSIALVLISLTLIF